MAPQSISAAVFAAAHPHIAKRTNFSRLIFSIIVFLVGFTLLVYGFRMEESVSLTKIGLGVIGFSMIAYSLYRFWNRFDETIYVPTGSITKERSFYFDLKHLDDLHGCVDTGDFSRLSGVRADVNGNIRMDLMVSRDRKFVAVQLFQFVPYVYQPITTVYYYTNGEADSIIRYLDKQI